MNQEIFFATYLQVKAGVEKQGMSVRIPAETDRLPGERISALTEAVRELANTQQSYRLRTEILVSPLTELETRPLVDYLWADDTFNKPRFIRHLKEFAASRIPHHFFPHPGVPVMGADLIGRQEILQSLRDTLAERRSCHLRAPRRYGKTSLLMRLAELLPKSVHIELSDVGSLPGFLKSLLRGCMRKPEVRATLTVLDHYRNWPDNVAVFNQAFEELLKFRSPNLLAVLRDTFGALAKGEVVLLVDEFSVFLREILEQDSPGASSFLDLFRRFRCDAAKPLVSVFAGSAGLSTYIEFFGMHKQFADLTPLDVPPISATKARILAEELFYGMEKRPALTTVERVVEFTGQDDSVPYFVHALTNVTAEEAGMRREIKADDVDRAYYDRLLGPSGNIYFRDFLLRERAYPSPYRACASAILRLLSRQFPAAVPEVELQGLCDTGSDYEKLMTCLEEDYDLVKTHEGWQMRSRVLADRWRLGEPWLTRGSN